MDSIICGTQTLVHLDLKGAPPQISYLEKILPFIREMGATGILLEWEDTFPYKKDLSTIGSVSIRAEMIGAPYSVQDAKHILDICLDCGLTVIPLVQTFGHMEYILKHEQWRHLREVDAFPSSMCPSNSATLPLVRDLIKQIVDFHPDIQYLHIGADEIWHLGLCNDCLHRASTHKHGNASIFLDHVTNVAQFIKEKYPKIKIIMWDDMLRKIDLSVLQDYHIGNLVEPMVWYYNNKSNFNLGSDLWEKYGSIFKNIWAATAFKGAAGSCQILPINKHYVENHEAWLSELGMHGNKIETFKGVALTGWSRYDHYATVCELLPTAIPSLALCLKTWHTGEYTQNIYNSVSKMLGYTEPNLQILPLGRPCPIATDLNFPGWQVLTGVEWFVNVRVKYKNITESDQIKTWFNPWQVANNYTNPMQIESLNAMLAQLLGEINSMETYLKMNLEIFFYQPLVEEFLGTLVAPMKQHALQLKRDVESQLSAGCQVRCMDKSS